MVSNSQMEARFIENKLAKPELYVDDWGLSKEVNDAILEMGELHVLKGVSVLIDSPWADYRLSELLEHSEVQIGLHLNGTENFTDGSCLPRWMSWPSYKRFKIQYEALCTKVAKVDYIDGHHHFHLYPHCLKQTEALSRVSQAPIRIIDDPAHFGSWFLSLFAKLFLGKSGWFCCSYLTRNDLMDRDKLRKKLWARPIVVHLSTRVNGSHAFEEFRYNQFQMIRGLLNE